MSRRFVIPAFAAVLLGGCMTGQDYVRPELAIPDNFRHAGAAAKEIDPLGWWEQFNDPVLTEHIQVALDRNLDLRIAAARLQEYQATYIGAGAPALPQVGLGLNNSRSRQGNAPIAASYQGYFSLSWELDFWGRIRRLSEAAHADFIGQEQAQKALVLSLVSSVATSYIQLRELDFRLAIGRRTLEARKESERLAKLSYQTGVISEMELRQAGSEYQGTAINVQQLELAVAQKENELNLLLGRNPEAIKRGRSIDELAAPVIPAGLPSQLLARRPDILQAEQALIAANARVGSARANLFPTISLTGTYGVASAQLSGLFSGANRAWAVAPSTPLVSLPIFSGGSLLAQLTASEAQRDQALTGYQKAVQSAFRETEDALVGVTKSGEQKQTQSRLVAELRRYAYLARLRYENGVTSNLEVLDSQRNLYSAEQGLAQNLSAALIATVNLYKALGGDWHAKEAPVPPR
jgi:multidrug efflux system outer membrane protein